VKTGKLIGVVLILATTSGLAPAQPQSNPEDLQKEALEVLRRTVADRERAVRAAAQPGAPPSVTSPAPTVPAAPTAPPAAVAPRDFKEVERLYLEGKISAKQFQSYLRDYRGETAKPIERPAAPPPVPAGATTGTLQEQALEVLRQQPPPGATTPATATPPPPAVQSAIPDVEKKLEELERLKAARERAAKTEPPPATPATEVKTKRQRLDELLKLYIEGKVSDAEYNERRAKIVAEKE
jgi:hypothetical protein